MTTDDVSSEIYQTCQLALDSEEDGLSEKDRMLAKYDSRRKRNRFDEPVFPMYLATLEETGAYVTAADRVNCLVSDAWKYRKEHPEFQLMCDLALERYRNMFIRAAQKRAVSGYEVPLIGGKHRDEIVAHERKYSDNLMALFLKRADPTFKENPPTVTVYNETNIRQEMNLGSLSKRARVKLRELLEIIKEDNEIKDEQQRVALALAKGDDP